MAGECCGYGEGITLTGTLACAMAKYIGQTVTIFTNSGGMSGCGFTGVLMGVNEHFVKLLTQIGPAPGCALGNACDGNTYANGMGCMGNNMNNTPIGTVGSVTDIPVCNIASFVHSAI